MFNYPLFLSLRVVSFLIPLAFSFQLHSKDASTHFNELVSEGYGGVRLGNSADLGDYILSVSMSPFTSGTEPSTAIETVRLIAQRDLAGILGTKCPLKLR